MYTFWGKTNLFSTYYFHAFSAQFKEKYSDDFKYLVKNLATLIEFYCWPYISIWCNHRSLSNQAAYYNCQIKTLLIPLHFFIVKYISFLFLLTDNLSILSKLGLVLIPPVFLSTYTLSVYQLLPNTYWTLRLQKKKLIQNSYSPGG